MSRPWPAFFIGVVGARPGATFLSVVPQLAPDVDPLFVNGGLAQTSQWSSEGNDDRARPCSGTRGARTRRSPRPRPRERSDSPTGRPSRHDVFGVAPPRRARDRLRTNGEGLLGCASPWSPPSVLPGGSPASPASGGSDFDPTALHELPKSWISGSVSDPATRAARGRETRGRSPGPRRQSGEPRRSCRDIDRSGAARSHSLRPDSTSSTPGYNSLRRGPKDHDCDRPGRRE